MRGLRMIWAALTGWMIDYMLTFFVVGSGYAVAGITTNNDLDFSRPVHVLLGLILPVLMTLIGGGVAGAIAPQDATPAGALVGGIGLLMMLGMDMSAKYTLATIIAQCVAVAGGAGVATLVARRQRKQVL